MATASEATTAPAASRTITEQEAEFLVYMESANKAKKEYARLYLELVQTLSKEHIDELATIFQEKEKIVLNKEQFLGEVKGKFSNLLQSSLELTWDAHNIGENISFLEKFKHKFKNAPSPNWRPHGNNVILEKTLPIRMRCKENQLRYLKKQTALQQTKLDNIMKTTATNRDQIKKIQVKRRYVNEQMQRGTERLGSLGADYRKFQQQVLYYPQEQQDQQPQQQGSKEKED